MTNTPLPNGLFETDQDWPTPTEVLDAAPEARGLVAEDEETPEPMQDLPVERVTFVLVPVEATERYWEGYAYGCGFQVVDGRRYRIVATKRTGATGASDAQYIIDRMASGLHFAKLKAEVDRAAEAESYRDRTVAPQYDPNRASPTGRDLERMQAAEWAGEDL